jgi:uncharacterized protein
MLHENKGIYLAHSLAFKSQETALIESFSQWLPERMIDCHAHSNLPEHAEYMTEKTYRHMLSTFPSFTIGESRLISSLLHPGKKVRSLRFAKTFRGINHRKANEYLLEKSDREDRIAIFGLSEDVLYTIEMLRHPRASALKMYYSYVEPTATEIYQCFKPEILEVSESLGIPIILHLPKMIVPGKDDLLKVTRDFPRLKISIAHLGSTKFVVPGLEETYKEIADSPHVSLDTSLNPSPEVVSLALRVFGPKRIMFGSDEPLNLIRSRPYEHPQKGQRIITEYPYHWVDPEEHREYGHLARDAVHCHWLCLDALRQVIDGIAPESREEAKQDIFCDNAAKFFGF